MILKIKIKESSESLLQRAKSEIDGDKKDKLKLLKLIVDNEVSEIQQASDKLLRHRNTIAAWLNRYRKGGLKKLLEVNKPGTKIGYLKYLSQEQLNLLKAALNNDKGFSSYKEIQLWLKKELKVEIPYPALWNLVRKRLKAKLKVPRPVNTKKDIEKEEAFKKTLLKN